MKSGSGVKVTKPVAATVSTPRTSFVTGSLTITVEAAQSGGGSFAAHRKIPLGT
jgi:hypothetical protein